ncbi:glycoside hydrolase family 19 protein [Brevundimonas sp. S30B]|uniref:glycoside hydrolase family 19 protein n=1 Tax=unclassified Brevundimonas TaxID=2622653 RepID=UPI001072C2FD|nr:MULTISPECIES: glycoside hydrolase family 19 protein [unclassified Brevundimonas]QBX38684.1 glycoside hydrolase family 19 protein [Brevundimonas sp. MF30-B]TFW01275.1 glycoside hydrolase family 19 protein [Brevundimonas sp. S30B]
MTTRAALAAAVRSFAPGGKLQTAHIPALNALADALGLPQDGETARPLIDAAKFAAWAPRAVSGAREALEAAARRHGLTDRLVLAHWLGQNHHESAGFSRLEENLNYSAVRMTQVWPSRFPTVASAQPFANNPQALANNVYGGRMGNTRPGDGWLFRGRGFKMITGADNYRALGYYDRPDALLDVREAADASALFFVSAGGVALARADDITGLSRKINGGLIGLDDRKAQTARAKQVVA